MSVQLLERIEEHEIEPELLRDAPRRLRFTYWSSMAFGACVAAFLVVGVSVLCIAVQSGRMMWLSEHGRTAVAKVTNCSYLDGSTGVCKSGSNQIEAINYSFNAYGSIHRGAVVYNALRDQIDFTKPSPLLLVRYGVLADQLVYSPARSLSSRSEMIAIIGDLAVGLICLFCAARWLVWNARIRKLVRYGSPVIGTIKDKTITDDDGPRYFVTVGFIDEIGTPHQFRERCTPDQWRRLDIGQPVTTLTLGTNHSACAIYSHIPLRCA